MREDEYIKLAGVTEKPVDGLPMNSVYGRMTHAIMGMVSEAGEYLKTALRGEVFQTPEAATKFKINRLEELGDIYWYIALYARLHSTTFDMLKKGGLAPPICDSKMQMAAYLTVDIAQMDDDWKKTLFYGKEPEWNQFHYRVGTILKILDALLELEEVRDRVVWELNIEKLAARFPDGFSEFHALNRDLDKEMAGFKAVT